MAHLSIINADGSPQVGVIWIGLDGKDLGSGHMGRPAADPKQLGGIFFSGAAEPRRIAPGTSGADS